jgi:hypothetical protein
MGGWSGFAVPVADSRKEVAGFFRVSEIKVISRPTEEPTEEPSFQGLPPDLEAYRARGHRRLSKTTYDSNALPAFGAALCLLRSSLINGTHQRKSTASRPSATAQRAALITRLAPREKFLAEKE